MGVRMYERRVSAVQGKGGRKGESAREDDY